MSDDMSAQAKAANRIPPFQKVDVFLTGGVQQSAGYGYIWCHEDAFRVRQEFRILGDFCGTLPKHTSQNQYLALPLVLSFDEVVFGRSKGWFRVVSDSPLHDYKVAQPEDVAKFYEERQRDEERQADETVNHQMAERAKLAKLSSNKAVRPRKRRRESSEVAVQQRKVRRVQDLPFMARLSFTVRRVLHGLLPSIAQKPELGDVEKDSERHDGEVLVDIPDDEDAEISDEDAAEAEREQLLKIRLKQQARATTLVITATGARGDERKTQVREVKEIPIPEGVCKKKLRLRQAVFRNLHGKGYYLSCGAKFGADFLAYASDPQLFHAALAVVVRDADDEVSPHDIVALGRLGDSTKKRTVLAYVETMAAGEEHVDYLCVQWEETLP